jgi:hypothetical protein
MEQVDRNMTLKRGADSRNTLLAFLQPRIPERVLNTYRIANGDLICKDSGRPRRQRISGLCILTVSSVRHGLWIDRLSLDFNAEIMFSGTFSFGKTH